LRFVVRQWFAILVTLLGIHNKGPEGDFESQVFTLHGEGRHFNEIKYTARYRYVQTNWFHVFFVNMVERMRPVLWDDPSVLKATENK
jgi:hypothetical protein